MKKSLFLLAGFVLSIGICFTSFAGEWKQDTAGWRYQNDDGSYPANQWLEIEGKYYYFDETGYMLSNAQTPDGHFVDTDGSWINSNTHSSEEEAITDASSEQSNDLNSYEGILNAYTQKLRNATPTLIEEYKNEAKQNTNGVMGLAEICTNKVADLAEITTEGVGKMATIYLNSGSGHYSEYEDWAGKLYDVYETEAEKIYDVYMNSAM